ncbi:ABC transporter ATP-binding protein [Sphingobium chungangianum]
MTDTPLLRVRDLNVTYRLPGARLHAVRDVSFELHAGEVLGLVGESGCGKSSVAKSIMQLIRFGKGNATGSIAINGIEVNGARGAALKALRSKVQMVFQDPVSSLNPRRRVGDLIEEGLVIAGGMSPDARRSLVRQTMAEVGLDPDAVADRFPHEFSGGQCQRISIARALVLKPQLLVCDEPVSALDVSVQAQILNLLDDLRVSRGLSMLFVSHDMAVIKNICDRVLVMYLGRPMETGSSEAICNAPRHPYSRALVASVPRIDDDPAATLSAPMLSGEIPSPLRAPTGCPLHERCGQALPVCSLEWPGARQLAGQHILHCHNPAVPDEAGTPHHTMLETAAENDVEH